MSTMREELSLVVDRQKFQLSTLTENSFRLRFVKQPVTFAVTCFPVSVDHYKL
jgi:hypothetical protein